MCTVFWAFIVIWAHTGSLDSYFLQENNKMLNTANVQIWISNFFQDFLSIDEFWKTFLRIHHHRPFCFYGNFK